MNASDRRSRSIWEDTTQVVALPGKDKKQRPSWARFLAVASIVALVGWLAIRQYESASESTSMEPTARPSAQGGTRASGPAEPARFGSSDAYPAGRERDRLSAKSSAYLAAERKAFRDGLPDLEPTPGVRRGVGNLRIEVKPSFTDIMIPIEGELERIDSFLWVDPVAIAINLPRATTPLGVGNYPLKQGSAKTLIVAKTSRSLRLRVLLQQRPKDYEVVCVPQGIIVRFSTEAVLQG